MEEDRREQELYERDLKHPDELSEESTAKDQSKEDPTAENSQRKKNTAAGGSVETENKAQPPGGNDPDKKSAKKIPGRGTLAFLKTVAAIEAVVIALGVGIIGGLSLANKVSPFALLVEAGKLAAEPEKPDPVGAGEETGRYIQNLTERLAAYPADAFFPFTASVEEVDNLETFCLTGENVKIYFQNEYTYKEVDLNKRIRLENESRVIEFQWDYDLSGDLTSLVPEVGAFDAADTTKRQLLFRRYASSQVVAEELRFVDMDRLVDYEPLYLKQELLDYFIVDKQVTAFSESVMRLIAGETVYRYYMSEELVSKELSIEDNFILSLEDGAVEISCVVGVEGGGYLGELTAAITRTGQGFEVTDYRFGAYSYGDIEDPEKETIITPQENLVSEYITMSGKGGERFYIPLSDKLQRMSYNKKDIVTENGFKVYREDGVKTSKIGIDVSRYQGNINWQQVKNAGVEFAIIRLGYRGYGEGTLELDPYYERNIREASAVGIPVGVYFFSQAITVQEAREEAEFVLKWIQDYQIDYPIIFDTEAITGVDARANEMPRELRTDIAIAFCERIKEGGYRPMVYANTRWLILNVNLERLSEYDLWYAYFGDNLTFPYHFDMWQYSDKGTVPGIEGAVDLNICFYDYAK